MFLSFRVYWLAQSGDISEMESCTSHPKGRHPSHVDMFLFPRVYCLAQSGLISVGKHVLVFQSGDVSEVE